MTADGIDEVRVTEPDLEEGVTVDGVGEVRVSKPGWEEGVTVGVEARVTDDGLG